MEANGHSLKLQIFYPWSNKLLFITALYVKINGIRADTLFDVPDQNPKSNGCQLVYF